MRPSQTIRNWKRLPQFKVALAEEIEIDAELHRFELKALYGKALKRVSELIDDKNPQIALAASKLAIEAEASILRIAEEREDPQGPGAAHGCLGLERRHPAV